MFLNSVVGQVFSDPDVLDGLIRYVREGGGVAGLHSTTSRHRICTISAS